MAKQLVPIAGAMLRWAREEAELSQVELASLLEAEPPDVAAWESGEALPSKGTFTRIAQKLKRPSAIFSS